MVELTDDDREYCRLLEQCESDASAAFDKTAVTLAAGALALSLTFLKDIAPAPSAWTVWWLLAPAWFCLVVALLFNFSSLMTSMESMRYQLQIEKGIRDKPKRAEPAGGPWRKAPYWCNYGALITCVLGIALLFTFAVLNAERKPSMAKSEPAGRQTNVEPVEQRGRVTPDRPALIDTPPATGAGRITPGPSPRMSVFRRKGPYSVFDLHVVKR